MSDSLEASPSPTSDPATTVVRRAASLPPRSTAGAARAVKPGSNVATAAAMFAVMFAAFVALALFAAVGLGGVAAVVMMVPLGFGLLSLFHYVTWGWWMSQLRDEDES